MKTRFPKKGYFRVSDPLDSRKIFEFVQNYRNTHTNPISVKYKHKNADEYYITIQDIEEVKEE